MTDGRVALASLRQAASTVAPERLVVNGQYSDERFIDMMVPHHMMAVQMAQVASQKGQHSELIPTCVQTNNLVLASRAKCHV